MNKHIGSSLDEAIKSQMKDEKFASEFARQQIISEIAQKVYNLRINAGLTQTKMAKESNTTQQVIARIEGGKDTRMPSIDLLSRIANAAGKSIRVTFK